MSGYKRLIDEVRDEGTEDYFKGLFRTSNPRQGTNLEEFWFEGWDYAHDYTLSQNQKHSENHKVIAE